MTNRPKPHQTFFAELKRRQVFKVAAVYGAVAFAVMQAADFLVPALRLPEAVATAIALVAILGFPLAIVLAWAFEMTPAGVQRERSASSGELESIVAQPRSSRWPAGILALLGVVLVAGSGWWVLGRQADAASDRVAAAVAPNLTVDHRSIAVLPFANMSGDPENEYFSEGITDDIITHLTKFSDLKVISRTSVMRFKDTAMSLREIASELGVATILEGGVRRSDDRVRINAQLIDAATDEHIWAEQYNRELTDVFAIQTDVALQIAGALQAQLSPEERGQVERRPTENLEAYNLYLQGRYFWNKRTREGLESAIEHFRRAIDLDPEYALAWVGLSDAYTILADWGYVSLEKTIGEATAAATRALEIDETLGEAHIALAQIKAHEWDWSGASEEFERGLRLSPGYASGHQWYGTHLGLIGRSEDSIREMERARELDPLSLIINANVGMVLRWAGRHEEAVKALRRTLELDPDFVGALQELGLTFEERSKFEDAIGAYERSLELSGGVIGYGELGHVYAVTGRRPEALEMLQRLEAEATRRYVPPAEFAVLHAGLGNTDIAFEWLEESYRQRDATLAWRTLTPGLDELRQDPRFDDLLARLGLADR
ncbi:MAG: tetratricopeptide repeat protein [Gemmatimonadales bacterium]|jgi:TolB-like protein